MNFNSLDFTNHETYFEIAREHLQISERTDSDLDAKVGVNSSTYKGVPLDMEGAIYLCNGLNMINKSNIVTIVFAALSAESFINYYALSYGKDEAYLKSFKSDKVLRLGETVVKWIQIPNDVNGKSALTANSADVNNLQKLFNDRNKLAHHKASIQSLKNLDWSNIQDPNSIQIADARSGYQAVITAVEALKNIDNSIDTTWLCQ